MRITKPDSINPHSNQWWKRLRPIRFRERPEANQRPANFGRDCMQVAQVGAWRCISARVGVPAYVWNCAGRRDLGRRQVNTPLTSVPQLHACLRTYIGFRFPCPSHAVRIIDVVSYFPFSFVQLTRIPFFFLSLGFILEVLLNWLIFHICIFLKNFVN